MLFGLNPKLMGWPIPSQRLYVNYQPCHRSSISLRRTLKAGGGSQNGGGGGQANRFLLPGATMATLMMLGALHARRLYEDKKELPIWLRPYVYRGWARAFHSNSKNTAVESSEQKARYICRHVGTSPIMGLFYCVLYLGPGDYHRVHSPVDWQVLHRRHFSGRLFPVNERAARTIRNLHVENERVVLEGKWSEGFLAMAAVGATNVGSIELAIEPELKTNRPKLSVLRTEPPSERTYGINDAGILLKKGQEVGVQNIYTNLQQKALLHLKAKELGSRISSTLFKSNHDASSELEQQSSSGFRFTVKNGDRVQMGQAIGRW